MKNKKPLRFNFVQITRLNHLNTLLRNRQKEIARKVDEYMTELEREVKKPSENVSNYDIKVTVHFYQLKYNQPVHANDYYVNIRTLRDFMEKFDDINFDWWSEGMPLLDEPYCYLFAKLFEQWDIVHRISEIAMVWTSIGVERQNCVLLEEGEWKFISKYNLPQN